ncbi:MAG: energy transducer TonB [Myxococcaceae bacterium]|nr:energy transducer TonB [Myxococcaceae bacterium]
MFDSVLHRETAPKSRLGAGVVVTVLVHLAAVFALVWAGSRSDAPEPSFAEVKFFAGRPAAPAPPPPPAAPAAPTAPARPAEAPPKVEKRPARRELVAPKQLPTEKPKEAEPEPAAAPEPAAPAPAEGPTATDAPAASSEPAGSEGGAVGGTPGGTPGGSGTDVVAFGPGMTRPENIKSPPAFSCPREAKEAGVEGVLLASCTVTLEGTLKACKIIKPLPFMEDVALDLLARWKVGVVTFQGEPVRVNYKIPIRMVCK